MKNEQGSDTHITLPNKTRTQDTDQLKYDVEAKNHKPSWTRIWCWWSYNGQELEPPIHQHEKRTSWGTYAQRRWKWCLLHHLPRGAWNGTLFVSERPSGTTRRSASRLGNGFPERREPHATFLAWSAFWLKLSFGNRWMDAKLVELHKFKTYTRLRKQMESCTNGWTSQFQSSDL